MRALAQSCTSSVVIGLWLSLALIGCGDDESPAPDHSDQDAATGGDRCAAKPLDEYCTSTEVCPPSLAEATESTCSMPIATRAEVKDNSCGGRTLRIDGLGARELHYDAGGELIGVRTESDLVHACTDEPDGPSSSAYTFGRECIPAGTPEAACDTSCPDIDCIAGAELDADWPFTLAQARAIPITVCRNDECFTGMLGQGNGFNLPDPATMEEGKTGSAMLSFRAASDGGVDLHLWWIPWSQADLRDGDRYRVSADAPDGTRVLIDHVIDYGTSSAGGGACRVICTYASVDLRGIGDLDGGTDDDAGL